jgi:serine/threonine protein kinase
MSSLKELWQSTYKRVVTDKSCLNQPLNLLACGENSCVVKTEDKANKMVYKVTSNKGDLTHEMRALQALDGLNGHAPKLTKEEKKCGELFVMGESFISAINLSQRMSDEGWYTIPSSIEKQILKCIYDMHERGVAHSDLHDQNILINPQNFIYIIDFGEARLFDDLERSSAWRDFAMEYPSVHIKEILKLGDYLNLLLTLIWYVIADMPYTEADVDPAPLLRRYVAHQLKALPHFAQEAQRIHAAGVVRVASVVRRAFPIWSLVKKALKHPLRRDTARQICDAF